MPEQDPLSDFLSGVAEKIKLAKEHKNIMEAVYSSASATEIVKEQEDPFVNFLKKVGETVSSKLPTKSTVQITEIMEQPENTIENNSQPEENAAKMLGQKIKDAIQNAKQQPAPKEIEIEPAVTNSYVQNEEEPTQELVAVQDLAQKIKDAIEKAKNKALDPAPVASTSTNEDEQVATYIGELEKIKDTGTAVQKEEANSTLKELKEYIDKTVRDYSRRILDLGGGGGSVAVQYANGGTMNGALNVNGQILSGGRDISNYFGGEGGGGDLNVNTVVYTSSAKWNDTYTTVNNYSGDWSSGLQTLAFNENNFDLSISSGNTVPLSSLKVDLSEVAASSAYWADTRYNVTFEQNVTINGNLTALGSSTFKNTIFTTTSALSVINTGPGPALYVFQSSGPYDVASFYDGDGIEVLHVGNAQGGDNPLGKIGINTSFPSTELTVNGQISSNNTIIALNGNSDDWNSVYTTVNLNSAIWDDLSDLSDVAALSSNWNSVYATTQNNSGGWESTESTLKTYSASWTSTYNTYNSLSASYTTDSLAIAYAVAL